MKFKFLQKPLVLLMLLTAWGSFSAFGQKYGSGNVVSNENEPLIGVTVVVQTPPMVHPPTLTVILKSEHPRPDTWWLPIQVTPLSMLLLETAVTFR
ncbi:MAG: hypothetical protein R2778_10290 [Saprospiraceae bacterium]